MLYTESKKRQYLYLLVVDSFQLGILVFDLYVHRYWSWAKSCLLMLVCVRVSGRGLPCSLTRSAASACACVHVRVRERCYDTCIPVFIDKHVTTTLHRISEKIFFLCLVSMRYYDMKFVY